MNLFTKESGISFGNSTFDVRAGYPRWFVLGRLNNGTPVILDAPPGGEVAIYKWIAGNTWSVAQSTQPADQFTNSGTMAVDENDNVLVYVANSFRDGVTYEWVVTSGATNWSTPTILFPNVSGSRYTNRLRGTVIAPQGQNPRVLLGWSVWYETPVAYHNIFFLDRLVSQALTQTPPGTQPVPAPTPTTTIPGDINRDGVVNSIDWGLMNSSWLTNNASADLNSDGTVNSIDFSIMNSNWLRTN